MYGTAPAATQAAQHNPPQQNNHPANRAARPPTRTLQKTRPFHLTHLDHPTVTPASQPCQSLSLSPFSPGLGAVDIDRADAFESPAADRAEGFLFRGDVDVCEVAVCPWMVIISGGTGARPLDWVEGSLRGRPWSTSGARRIICTNSSKSISPSPFLSTSLMMASTVAPISSFMSGDPSAFLSSSGLILPSPSRSKTRKAAQQTSSERYLVLSMVAAMNSV
mmetsp:Transcript_27374/g.78752  ORF Transcript_27374/g.78752 Transcript_27374/m.78752 type:complete len:221 (-) Transcript_27374:1420-2082(-)